MQVRAVVLNGRQVVRYDCETNTLWFDASRHDATFVITYLAGNGLSPSAEPYFCTPETIGHVAHCVIFIYQKNLLKPSPWLGQDYQEPRHDQRALASPGARHMYRARRLATTSSAGSTQAAIMPRYGQDRYRRGVAISSTSAIR